MPGHSMLIPRNIKQVRNAQYSSRQKMRLTRDAMYNLHEIAYEAPHFVKRIATFPDLQVICLDNRMAAEFNKLLQEGLPSMMTYDTTFQLGDFYVSPLLCTCVYVCCVCVCVCLCVSAIASKCCVASKMGICAFMQCKLQHKP